MSSIPSSAAQGRSRDLPVLLGTSSAHFLNDLAQSLLIASYPLLRGDFSLDFTQLGFLTLANQVTASVLQPVIGIWADRKPRPWSLAVGMSITCLGLLFLAWAQSYVVLLAASVLLGLGSAIFHPEAARAARRSSGGRHGLAQSIFQLGGHAGSALGPLMLALFVLPRGQSALAWFAPLMAAGIALLAMMGRWTHRAPVTGGTVPLAGRHDRPGASAVPVREPVREIAILLALIAAKFSYLACFENYFVFYLGTRFGTSIAEGQIVLFVFLGASALGGIVGGHLTDRVGTRAMIVFSFWGALPFSLAVPYLGPELAIVSAIFAGAILASAFSAIVVHAQTLMPHRIGMVSGLFFGAAFGVGGLAAAALGVVADGYGVEMLYRIASWLPLAGLLTVFLNRPARAIATG